MVQTEKRGCRDSRCEAETEVKAGEDGDKERKWKYTLQ